MHDGKHPWSFSQRLAKRGFDFGVASIGLAFSAPVIGIAWLVASCETRANGFFLQDRIGRNGRVFRLIKIRTMVPVAGITSHVTAADDRRITRFGRLFRKTKIDELPQLWNVLVGDMSFVGPRPDVRGYADRLEGKDRTLLSVRPGITGPATLKYRNEEELLAQTTDRERYNDEIIWPDKVRLNLEYIENYSFSRDLVYIWKSIFA